MAAFAAAKDDAGANLVSPASRTNNVHLNGKEQQKKRVGRKQHQKTTAIAKQRAALKLAQAEASRKESDAARRAPVQAEEEWSSRGDVRALVKNCAKAAQSPHLMPFPNAFAVRKTKRQRMYYHSLFLVRSTGCYLMCTLSSCSCGSNSKNLCTHLLR